MVEDFMEQLQMRHEMANRLFKEIAKEKCGNCGMPMNLVVAMPNCAFLICGNCKHQAVKSMDTGKMKES